MTKDKPDIKKRESKYDYIRRLSDDELYKIINRYFNMMLDQKRLTILQLYDPKEGQDKTETPTADS